ncbi:MAG: metal ABC transporter substrate-binding protein [Desulfocucumaceae bacterium]
MRFLKAFTALVIILSLAVLGGCSVGGGQVASGGKAEKGKIKVITTIFPLYDFSSNIGGDRIEIYNLLPPGAEPHHWEPSPGDLLKVGKADVFIFSGAGLESWVEGVLGNTDSTRIMVVDSSQGLNLLEGNKEEQEEHGAVGGHEINAVHSGTDPHIWLDPVNAQMMVDNILAGLVKADPANKDYYTENATKYKSRLSELDERYKAGLSGAKIKYFVVSHDAFGYMARRYGLEQLPLRGLSADSEPSPARMAEIIGLIKKYGIKHIFYETLVSPKVSEAIAREAGVEILVLDPVGGLTEEEVARGKNYITLMEANLENLRISCEAR